MCSLHCLWLYLRSLCIETWQTGALTSKWIQKRCRHTVKDKQCYKWPQHTHICTHTQTQTHSNLNYWCKLGGGGDAGGGWWRLKWKSRTDQYCWRFSSLHSPLNCHAPSKQLKTLCFSSTPILLLSFTSSPLSLQLSVQVFQTSSTCQNPSTFFTSLHFLSLTLSLVQFFNPLAINRHIL